MNQITYTGSLAALARERNSGLAETFSGATLLALIDTSGSMRSEDTLIGRSRYDVACQQLAKLQADHPGQVAVVAFSSTVQPCPGGHPAWLGKGTDVATVLRWVTQIGSRKPCVLISDGRPDATLAALDAAESLPSERLDTIYVGPESDYEAQQFLKLLAARCKGSYSKAASVQALQSEIQRFLPAGTSQ